LPDRRDGERKPVTPADAGLIDALTGIVSRAAAAILAARAGALAVRSKADNSPVTAADEASEAIIMAGLATLLPGVPVVSEEAVDRGSPASSAETFVLVDPVDGTRELAAGRDEFSVNVAVVSSGRARLGIIAAPAFGLVWRTAAGGGAERLRLAAGAGVEGATERNPVRCRPWPALPTQVPVAAVSRSHLDAETDAFLRRLPPTERRPSGSAVKLAWIAEGAADVYPRLGRVREWDVAAGDAIVSAAGGLVTGSDGKPLSYGADAARFVVPGFVAWGDPAAAARLR
jgi:3'(2'), 5'-bisphosphate nucleotidase